MKKQLNKPLGIALLILSSIFLVGISSCQTKPDAYTCTFILKNELKDSYSICVNYKNGHEKNVSVRDMHKWVTTDGESYENFRQWYTDQCKP